MMEKTLKIIGNISAISGILIFIFPLLSLQNVELRWWQWAFISISILISLFYIIYELCSGPKKYKNKNEIKKYMQKWITQSGRIVIFTRDMSWVDDNSIKENLREKARNNELIICHPKKTPFSIELEQLGAEVFEYPNLNFVPKSRFTFIRYNTASSKVAIGKTDSNHIHYIEEHSQGDMQYYLAEDLINLVKALP